MTPELRAKYHELLDDALERDSRIHKLHDAAGNLVAFALVVVPRDLPEAGRMELGAGILRALLPEPSPFVPMMPPLPQGDR